MLRVYGSGRDPLLDKWMAKAPETDGKTETRTGWVGFGDGLTGLDTGAGRNILFSRPFHYSRIFTIQINSKTLPTSILYGELKMATKEEQPKAVAEEAKIDLFEDDDEFEEFEIDQGLLEHRVSRCYPSRVITKCGAY
nr:hypothetical protein [Tanacetum cinerariifolium]